MYIDYTAIGARIRENRQHRSMSQERLAELANVEPSYISSIEHGHKKPSLETLLKVSNALNLTVNNLLVDVQPVDSSAPVRELELLLDGCDQSERIIIIQAASALKTILHHARNR